MLGRTYDSQNCSAARTLEVVGERWSLLIIRDALFVGLTRFRDFQRSLGVASNILSTRLDGFVNHGIMERRRYGESADQFEYVLTDRGRDLQPVIIALTGWGDRWAAPAGPPVIYVHADCGGDVEQRTQCTNCGDAGTTVNVKTRPGPGATTGERAASGGH